jgi:L-iditol 2-dehydrogenase
VRALRLHGKGDLRLHEEERPQPQAGETLVCVGAVGLCGSDLHWFGEGAIGETPVTRPLVLGHEFAGVTDDGRRVAVDPAVPCQACPLCLEGHPNLCEAIRFAGHGENDGGLREWMAWPERCLVPLPAGLTVADGALLEPLGVALHAADLAHLRPGARVGVFGCGPLGLLIVQVARLSGAGLVVATDIGDRLHRLEAARRLGAVAFVAEGGREARAIRDACGNRGLDVAIEAAGENAAVDAAVEAVRPGARIVLAGIPAEERTSFVAAAARRKGLTLVLARRMKHTYPRAIRLVESGQVNLGSVVTHRFPLERGADAFAVALRREGLKVLVQPS